MCTTALEGVCQDTSEGIRKRPPGPMLSVRPAGAVRHAGKVRPVVGQGGGVAGAPVCGEPLTAEFDFPVLVRTRLFCKVHRDLSYGFLEELVANAVPIPTVLAPVKLAEWAEGTPLTRRRSSARKRTVAAFTGRTGCSFRGKRGRCHAVGIRVIL